SRSQAQRLWSGKIAQMRKSNCSCMEAVNQDLLEDGPSLYRPASRACGRSVVTCLSWLIVVYTATFVAVLGLSAGALTFAYERKPDRESERQINEATVQAYQRLG